MKAFYDIVNRDYFIFINKNEIDFLMKRMSLLCDLYLYNDHYVTRKRRRLKVKITDNYKSLIAEYQRSKKKVISLNELILFEHNDPGQLLEILTINKEFLKDLQKSEFFKKYGQHEIRYNGSCKINIFSSTEDEFETANNLSSFNIIEQNWIGRYKKPK